MRKVALALLVILIVLGQQVPCLPLHFGLVDLSIPLLFTVGLWCGAVKGLALGFSLGLLQASFSGYLVGTFLLTRSLIGWGGGILQGVIVRENPWAILFAGFWASILNDLVFLLSFPRPLSLSWLYSLLIKGLTSAFFAPFFAFLLSRICKN